MSMYMPGFSRSLMGLIRKNSYNSLAYIKEFWQTQNFRLVKTADTLTTTDKTLTKVWQVFIYAQIIAGILVASSGYNDKLYENLYFGAATIIAAPVVWAHLIIIPLFLKRLVTRILRDIRIQPS